ncbi:chromatin assembly factor 1 subunit a caf-1 subunit a [Anaeramoeba flamelloides]|uniref:Chromatin assembly factor 1 subunit a caf-1 subunit a n=1 Tax=Anaeramoeba flamelloides TaxID=1746091 RepID=A0ABQ8X3R3_9EUKA|nr:chromatin assembly factor 1 subunit a caf-1 subunit a [Anaeramoeba flamelloides]
MTFNFNAEDILEGMFLNFDSNELGELTTNFTPSSLDTGSDQTQLSLNLNLDSNITFNNQDLLQKTNKNEKENENENENENEKEKKTNLKKKKTENNTNQTIKLELYLNRDLNEQFKSFENQRLKESFKQIEKIEQEQEQEQGQEQKQTQEPIKEEREKQNTYEKGQSEKQQKQNMYEKDFPYRRPMTRSHNNIKKKESQEEIQKKKVANKYGLGISSKYRRRDLRSYQNNNNQNNLNNNTRQSTSHKERNSQQTQIENLNQTTIGNSIFTKKIQNGLEQEREKIQKLRNDSTIVESGKDIFKLLTGVLWVTTGGASIKLLTPFSETISKKIGQVLNASKNEEKSFKNQLKYLLTNSRRTFTEFILEILIGILSLRFLQDEEEEELSIKFWDTLSEIVELQSTVLFNSQIQPQQFNYHYNKEKKKKQNEQGQGQDQGQKKEINKEYNNNEEQTDKLKDYLQKKKKCYHDLEDIYQQLFTKRILMFWFSKRFIDRLEVFFGKEISDEFYSQHLFYFGKSKFMLSSIILANELINQEGVTKDYAELIDLEYNYDSLNLYSNNRGKKQGLIKELIVKYQLNSGHYWQILSKEYLSELDYNHLNLFQFSPFKQIISNPLLLELCGGNTQEKVVPKKRVITKNENINNDMLNIGWIMKKDF